MNLDERIRIAMIECFWDGLSDDISNNKFDSTLKIITEIRDRICLFAPSRNDLHAEIHEHLDIDYMRQMVANDAISPEYIHGIVNYIITQIKQFGSLHDEPWNEIWRTKCAVRMQEGEKLETFFPYFFHEALHRIELIEEGIQAFKQSEIYKELTSAK